MIAGASWMCCILSITEDGKQPEQPRSRTSRQFSISAVKLKTAAKLSEELSEEFKLWTANGKGMTKIWGEEKKKWGILCFWTASCSYITAFLLFLSKIRDSRLHLSSSSHSWQPGEIQVSWERWTRGDSPPWSIHSRVKWPRTMGYFPCWEIFGIFPSVLITLCLIFGTVCWVFHIFLRIRRLSWLFWMSEHISRGKKSLKAIAPQTARLKQFHHRFMWSHP